MTYEFKDTDTRLTLKKGAIEDQSTDGIVSWCARDLKSGPQSYYRLHNKAGLPLFNYMLDFDGAVHEQDCFSTMPGGLDCEIVFHCVMPGFKNNYPMAFLHLGETIKTYMASNRLWSVSLYIPEHADYCLAGIKSFLLDIGIREIFLLYHTDGELRKLKAFFDKHSKKKTIWERIEGTLWAAMYRLGCLSVKLPRTAGPKRAP